MFSHTPLNLIKPHLTHLQDPNFPESLIDLAPPAPAFAFDPDFNPPAHRIHSHGSGTSSMLSPHLTPHSTGSSPPSTQLNRLSSNNPFLAHANAHSQSQSLPKNQHFLPPQQPQHLPPMHMGLKYPLQVFSKGLDEMEWSFSSVQPGTQGRRGSATAMRPISSSGLDDGSLAGWAGAGAGARRSVIVGNGFGGFLAVPVEEAGVARPKSASGERVRRGSQYDMWR